MKSPKYTEQHLKCRRYTSFGIAPKEGARNGRMQNFWAGAIAIALGSQPRRW
jgi:hypothetical protein